MPELGFMKEQFLVLEVQEPKTSYSRHSDRHFLELGFRGGARLAYESLPCLQD